MLIRVIVCVDGALSVLDTRVTLSKSQIRRYVILFRGKHKITSLDPHKSNLFTITDTIHADHTATTADTYREYNKWGEDLIGDRIGHYAYMPSHSRCTHAG